MDNDETFLAAIESDPDSAGLKLAYADWLEERGDVRAEAWRWIVQEGKRPQFQRGNWGWIQSHRGLAGPHYLPTEIFALLEPVNPWLISHHESRHAALLAAIHAFLAARQSGWTPQSLSNGE